MKIKKAYRKKSLELHPDKVAQRRQKNSEEAAAEYEKVQEAYGVLSDTERRNLYGQLGHSPARYKFAQNGGLYNPMQCYQNLGQASMVDKTRLVVVVAIFAMLFLLQPILVAARVNQELQNEGSLQNAPWVAILTPTWIMYALILSFWAALLVLGPPVAKLECALRLLEHVLWLTGLILVAQNWDRPLSNKKSWHAISTPLYLAIIVRVLSVVARFLAARSEFEKMISPIQLQKEVPDYEQLSEEDRAALEASGLDRPSPTTRLSGRGGRNHRHRTAPAPGRGTRNPGPVRRSA